MNRFLTMSLVPFCIFAVIAPLTQAQTLFQFPQTMVGQQDGLDFTTQIDLLNTGSSPCDVMVTYNRGAGSLVGLNLLTNGEDRGGSLPRRFRHMEQERCRSPRSCRDFPHPHSIPLSMY